MVHVAFFALMIGSGKLSSGGAGKESGDKQSEQQSGAEETRQIINRDKPAEMQIEIVDPPEKPLDDGEVPIEKKPEVSNKPDKNMDNCEPYFGGIGVTEQLDFDSDGRAFIKIEEVHRGYPAEAIGLRAGDVLVNNLEIKGEVGTPVRVIVSRNGQILEFSTIRARICLEEGKKKGP